MTKWCCVYRREYRGPQTRMRTCALDRKEDVHQEKVPREKARSISLFHKKGKNEHVYLHKHTLKRHTMKKATGTPVTRRGYTGQMGGGGGEPAPSNDFVITLTV